MSDNRILIIGGDKRQSHLCDILLSKGYSCLYENGDTERVLSKLRRCKYIILPVPVSKNGRHIYSSNDKFRLEIGKLFSELTKNHIIFGAGFNNSAAEMLEKKNIVYLDFNANEDFLLYNAVLTAQGAVCLLMNSTQRLVVGSKVLVTGYGRVARALVNLLKGMAAEVTVCARKDSQLTEAAGIGCRTLKMKDLGKVIHTYDYIFNTVPENIFSFSDIALIDNSACYFELASKPYGASEKVFEELDKRYVFGGSLPGKFLSESAGERIAAFIEKMV